MPAFRHNKQVASGQAQVSSSIYVQFPSDQLVFGSPFLLSFFFFVKQPDEYCYKTAIIACSAANQWGRALDLFRRFQRATDGTDRGALPPAPAAGGKGKGNVPGTAIYNAVITACARGLFTEEALAFFLEMGERGVPRDEVRAAAQRPFSAP